MMESFLAKSIQWTYDGLSSITFPVIMDEHDYNPSVYLHFLRSVNYTCFLQSVSDCDFRLLIAPYLHPAYIRIKPYFKDMRYFDMVDMINDELDNNICVTSDVCTLQANFSHQPRQT